MKPMRVILFKPLLKLKPKFCLKKGRLLMLLKESHLRRPRKKRLETSSDSKDYEEKDLVDDKSDGLCTK